MANLNKPTKWDFHTEGPSLTEQEHRESCDANKMLQGALRGAQIRGAPIGPWGEEHYDDTTMTSLDFRIKKAKIEKDLSEIASQHEFDEEELKLIPKPIQEKFKLKKKKLPKNDDKTTNLPQNSSPPESPPPKP